MRLLVSVANAAEASAALAGGADVIDAKDPRAGALGAVALDELRALHAVVGDARPMTAALGDATSEHDVERAARDYAAAGARLVKLGFAGTTEADRAERYLRAAVRGASGSAGHVVAAAYADAGRVRSLEPFRLIDAAAAAGAAGVLLDTADKGGPGLRELIAPALLRAWVARARAAGLLVALAGKLTADDLEFAHASGADIAGVRGAACEAGRDSLISAERVRVLRGKCLELSARGSAARASGRPAPAERAIP
jgi:uncharacterized protein (UPF0264 family)